jgi:PKD repeat protein
MKTKSVFLSISLFSYVFFCIPLASAETVPSPSIIISEIQIKGTKADDEFIRLQNTTSTALDLNGFKLTKKIISGATCKESLLVSTKHFQGIIQPQGSFLIAHPTYQDFYAAPLDYSSASYYLSENTTVLLYDQAGVLLDRKTIGEACDAAVPEVHPPATPPVPDTPPPAPIPDHPPEPTIPPAIPKASGPVTIRLNEIFPNPKAKGDAGEFIELYNFGTEPIDISGWTLRDATKTGKYTFPAGTVLAAGAYLTVTDQVFKLSLNNANETVTLLSQTDAAIDSAQYTTTKEDVSLNYTAAGWRGGVPTPGIANQLNSLPDTREKVPKKGYHGIAVAFDARGKDADHDTLKYTWDFGDGHKSYREKTTHVYEKNGTYTVTLKTNDGKEDALETFVLTIQSFSYPDIRITSLVPNPAGSDTSHEWILLENREKKTVNLKGFSIATGWKNLVNHPIREDFLIAPQAAATLTREAALFTLPNQKGKIELRAPDGKVLQEIKYKLEKSAVEDSIYRKEKGKRWEWQTGTALTQATTKSISSPSKATDSDAAATSAGEVSPSVAPLPVNTDEEEKMTETAAPHPDGTNKQFLPLLNYGTRVQISDDISLAFAETPTDATLLPEREHYAVTFAKESLTTINSTLNALLSESQ